MHYSLCSVFKKRNYYNLVFLVIFLFLTNILAFPMAFSESSNSFSTRSSRSRAQDFDLEFIATEFNAEPKSKDNTITLILYNTGDETDSFTLTFNTIPSGWKVQFLGDSGLTDVLNLDLAAGNSRNIIIYLEAPESGGGLLRVSCSSQVGQTTKSAEINLDAKFILTISLQNKSHEHSVNAGKSTTYTLEIKNHQDIPDVVTFSFQNIEIKIQDSADDFDWAVSFDNSSITLGEGESKIVILTVFAPVLGQPGYKLNIHATAKLESTDQAFDIPELIVMIPKIINVTYTLKQKTPSTLMLPNATVNYTLKLFNAGNIDILVSLSLRDNTDDWATSFFIDDNKTKPEDIELDIDGIVEMRLQVKIPFDAKNGTHRIIYGIYGQDKTSSSLSELSEIEIVTNVRLISGIGLNVPSDMSIDLGKTTKLQLKVHNQGNGMDTLNVSVFRDSVPFGWTVYFDAVTNTDSDTNVTKTVDFSAPIRVGYLEPTEYVPDSDSKLDSISLVMDANKIAYVRMSITTPTMGKAISYPITIYGESESGTLSTVIKDLSFNLRVSDLFLSSFKINPTLPIPGESVTAKINVTNNFHLPANNFKVTFYKITDLGETELGSKVVSNLPPGTSEVVEFNYEEADDAGDYILKAELTADFLPTSDNLFLKVLIGEKPEKKDETGFANLRNGLIIAIIIALIVFLLIWLVGTKRKTTEGTEGKLDPGSQRVSRRPKTSVDKLKDKKQKLKQKDSPPSMDEDLEKIKSKYPGKHKRAKKRK